METRKILHCRLRGPQGMVLEDPCLGQQRPKLASLQCSLPALWSLPAATLARTTLHQQTTENQCSTFPAQVISSLPAGLGTMDSHTRPGWHTASTVSSPCPSQRQCKGPGISQGKSCLPFCRVCWLAPSSFVLKETCLWHSSCCFFPQRLVYSCSEQ